jgi:hypothetical protein
VPIYYEARLAKIDLKPEERPKIDPNFEEVTEDAEESTKESLRRIYWRMWRSAVIPRAAHSSSRQKIGRLDTAILTFLHVRGKSRAKKRAYHVT